MLSYVDVATPQLRSQDADTRVYEGTLDESWFQGRGSFGGLLTAFALNAFVDHVGDARRRPRTLHAHFCAPVAAATYTLTTTNAREGSRVTHLHAELRQDGKCMALFTATFAAARDDELRVSQQPAPQVLPVDDAIAVSHEMPGVPVFIQHYDMRVGLGQPPYTGAAQARLGGHIRLRNSVPVNEALLSTYVDAWPPAAFACATSPRGGASVDLTLTFLEPPTGYAPGAFFVADVHSTFVDDGYSQETTWLHGPDGKPLVHCRQLVALL